MRSSQILSVTPVGRGDFYDVISPGWPNYRTAGGWLHHNGGKTFMVRKALEASGLMFIEENATQFSEVGYIGRDLAFMFNDFIVDYYVKGEFGVAQVIQQAQRWGVVVMDEFDKLQTKPNPKERQPGLKLQAELLKFVEGDLVLTKAHQEAHAGWPFRTHGTLFIGLGAFEGLDKQMEKKAGDGKELTNPYMQSEPTDIMEYGFLQELVGRFPTVIPLPPLRTNPMVRILRESVWPRYVQEAADAGVELRAEEGALIEVAQRAISKKIGARSFASLLEAMLWRATSEAEPGDLIMLTAQGVQNHTPKGGGAELIRRGHLSVAS